MPPKTAPNSDGLRHVLARTEERINHIIRVAQAQGMMEEDDGDGQRETKRAKLCEKDAPTDNDDSDSSSEESSSSSDSESVSSVPEIDPNDIADLPSPTDPDDL